LKVLILKPSSLGDVIHALPLLRLLKRHEPHAEIYWWLAADLLPLLEHDRDLSGIIPFHRNRWHSPFLWHEVFDSVARLRALEFDLVIDLQGLARSGLFAWLANGALTIGLDTGREGSPGFYDIAIPRPVDRPHAVDWCLAVLKWLGIPVDSDFEWLPVRPDSAAPPRLDGDSRWLAICPGARWNTKRWPYEYFQQLVKLMAVQYPDTRFAIIGSQEDASVGAAIASASPDRCLDLTGKTNLGEMVEWVRRCEAMVTNDTGPMHVAAAMRKPVVALFGPTNPERTGPYGQLRHVLTHPIPCSPCMKGTCSFSAPLECLRGITPEQAFREVQKRLSAIGR
jgi:lipopolysaccharide heptosyltransferase II